METDWKKKYEEALERMKYVVVLPENNQALQALKETVFPELAESEDERIRKALICGLSEGLSEHNWQGFGGATIDECLAYLERQRAKERLDRMAPIYNDKESFESALEKAWKYYNESASRTVDSFEDDYIECVFSKGFREGFLYKEKQKEQKPEGVYVDCTEHPDWYGMPQKPNYCHYGGDPNIERCRCCSVSCSGRLADEQKLAEYREVELTFRGEKVKVKRQFFRDDKGRKYSTTEQDEDAAWHALRAWCEKKGVSLYDLYPNTEWGKEDEKILNELITIMDGEKVTSGTYLSEYAAWLRHLPERFNLQPKQEWSKIDEQISNGLIKALENLSSDWLKLHGVIKSDTIAWLKYHHNNLSWKPSEEQIEALFWTLHQPEEVNKFMKQSLGGLYDDLKKL